MADGLDLEFYLQRLGFKGEPKPDLATLEALQAAHVRTIPFEGLDPFLRRPVSLDLDALEDKIIYGRRGGYCFELNTLFRAALEAIGFEVTGLAGRVRWMSPPDSPLGPREHMLLKVDLPDGPRLADVGFGACLLDAPLPLKAGAEVSTALGLYRLNEAGGRWSLSAKRGDDWRTLYVFDLEPQLPSDFEIGNWYTSTHATPPFQHVVIIELLKGDKRLKLVNRRFIVETRDGVVESERELTHSGEMSEILEGQFGISPPVGADDLFPMLPA